MRTSILLTMTLLIVAAQPALGQQSTSIEQRITALEAELSRVRAGGQATSMQSPASGNAAAGNAAVGNAAADTEIVNTAPTDTAVPDSGAANNGIVSSATGGAAAADTDIIKTDVEETNDDPAEESGEGAAQGKAKCKEYVCAGETPGSWVLPNTETTLKLGGYVKLDSIYDFQDAGDRFLFDPSTIPVYGGRGEQVTFHARQTRFNVDAKAATEVGDVHLFAEGDFFGQVNQFRMRHAFGEIGQFLAGQTWVLALDSLAMPETLDFNGPEGAIQFRRPQIRRTFELSEHLIWACSLHDSRNPLTTTVSGEFRSRIPVFTSSLRLLGDHGHLYWASGVGEGRFVPDVGNASTVVGWGSSLSYLRKFDKDSAIAQFGISDGFTEFLPVSSLEPAISSRIEALRSYGYVLAYQHYWSDAVRSTATYRAAKINNSASEPLDALHRDNYAAMNLIWSPLKSRQFDLGVEYLWGKRVNKDGANADANRLQFSVIYRLP